MIFLKKYKWWILIVVIFLLVRIIVFVTFWQASVDKGGWDNFYGWAQPASSVFLVNFHELCDWHPPFYYAFTSLILFLYASQWIIYIMQVVLAFLSVYFVYKIARLFFSEKIALIATFISAAEPFWAWHNFLLVSENLFIPIFLGAFYFLFKFLKTGEKKEILFSAIFMALSTLVRTTPLLLTIYLSFFVFLLFLLKSRLKLEDYLPKLNIKQIVISLIIFNVVFFAILTPWVIRNKIVYDRFTFDNISRSNFYFYNLPPLISIQKNISYGSAVDIVKKRAEETLGSNPSDKIDCNSLDKIEFNKQQDYYSEEARNFIFVNFFPYLKMHLVRAIPFFFQSGYFTMYSAFTGEYSKPDITSAFLKGDLSGVVKFFSDTNMKVSVYIFGVLFWGIVSLALFFSFLYSFFRDRRKFVFFFVALAVISYNALLVSPFVLARYRIPLYVFFFAPFVYAISVILKQIKIWHNRKNETKN